MLRALDLFCGAGGVARGLKDAGYYVVGVDIIPQPWYCGDEFVCADALALPPDIRLEEFDLVWASPPCQAFSTAAGVRRVKEAPNLIPAVRDLVAGHPATIIENVPPAPLRRDVVLEWAQFRPWPPFRRRRIFELTATPPLTPGLLSGYAPSYISAAGNGSPTGVRERRIAAGLPQQTPVADLREAFSAYWIPADAPVTHQRRALNAMIPSCYAEWLARQIRR